jgi:hypothetical protein
MSFAICRKSFDDDSYALPPLEKMNGMSLEGRVGCSVQGREQFMPHDIADAILAHVSNFAVGLVRRVEGAGSRVLGSGVLVSLDGRRGILTAGHVADVYRMLPEVGLVRFVAGNQQRRILPLGDTDTIIMESSDTFEDGKGVLDLAFTQLPHELAASIEAHGVFLNLEKNRAKIESPPPEEGKHCDAMLGLVAEFSGLPFVQGTEWISPMRGVLHTGHVCEQLNGLLTVEAMDYNLDKLPASFGGMSGGGLWRIYFVENEKEARIVSATLCGIASWQIDKTHIACQGWDRIDQTLIPAVRAKLPI